MSATNTCANCGKGEESSGDLKACTACKLVKYCNRECQIAHRPQHKKACKKRAAEIHDERIFKEHPREECPICMLPLPVASLCLGLGTTFYSCCGKNICNGCIYEMDERGGKSMELCPFCKASPAESDEDELKRVKRLTKAGNFYAYYALGTWYDYGDRGIPQDWAKANELYLKAGELGSSEAYYNLGIAHENGRGVTIDKKRARHYYELAAMIGDVEARHNLGMMEGQAGNYQRAYKHLLLSAKAGRKESLDMVKEGYMGGRVTKEEYANTLREYQNSQDEMKSDARDKALAARNEIRHG